MANKSPSHSCSFKKCKKGRATKNSEFYADFASGGKVAKKFIHTKKDISDKRLPQNFTCQFF
jgi:hypothetical protein